MDDLRHAPATVASDTEHHSSPQRGEASMTAQPITLIEAAGRP